MMALIAICYIFHRRLPAVSSFSIVSRINNQARHLRTRKDVQLPYRRHHDDCKSILFGKVDSKVDARNEHGIIANKSSIIHCRARFVPETQWRIAAERHASKIESLLSMGLLRDEPNHRSPLRLDPRHPIYNFLVEYYGFKGAKGVKRLMRWSPSPYFANMPAADIVRSGPFISLEVPLDVSLDVSLDVPSELQGGVFLENASVKDMSDGKLHLRGAIPIDEGILYNPLLYFASKDPLILRRYDQQDRKYNSKSASAFLWYRTLLKNTLRSEPILYCHGLHEWAMLYRPPNTTKPPPSSKYQSHLSLRVSQSVINEQVERKGVRCTHIDALRFFAAEARPLNHYGQLQSDNEEKHLAHPSTDENLTPSSPTEHSQRLTRIDQLHLEQKACLHANMDLLKIALRLEPFLCSSLLIHALEVALQARTLDVEASPYDVSSYRGVSGEYLGKVMIETEEGRKIYQWRQLEVMNKADIVRRELLDSYNMFLKGVFCIGLEDDAGNIDTIIK